MGAIPADVGVEVCSTLKRSTETEWKTTHVSDFSAEGGGCLSSMLVVRATPANIDEEQQFVLKLQPQNAEAKQIVEDMGWFQCEAAFYSWISKENSRKLFFTPQFHGIVSLPPPLGSGMLLQFIDSPGLKKPDLLQGLRREEALICLRALASLHMTPVSHELRAALPQEKNRAGLVKDMGLGGAKDYRVKYGAEHKELADVLEREIDALIQVLENSDEEARPDDVLLHGDCWSQNFLLPESESALPALLDFQCVSFGHPALDIGFLILSSMNPKDRRNSYREMVDTYNGAVDSCRTTSGRRTRIAEVGEWPLQVRRFLAFQMVAGGTDIFDRCPERIHEAIKDLLC